MKCWKCEVKAEYRNRYSGKFECFEHKNPIGSDTIEDYEKITGEVVE